MIVPKEEWYKLIEACYADEEREAIDDFQEGPKTTNDSMSKQVQAMAKMWAEGKELGKRQTWTEPSIGFIAANIVEFSGLVK